MDGFVSSRGRRGDVMASRVNDRRVLVLFFNHHGQLSHPPHHNARFTMLHGIVRVGHQDGVDEFIGPTDFKHVVNGLTREGG